MHQPRRAPFVISIAILFAAVFAGAQVKAPSLKEPANLDFEIGHNWLASKLRARKINFEMLDNAFTSIADWKKAQQISDDFAVSDLHAILDAAVARHCPALAPFGRYHWSIMQVEYATDIVFRSTDDLHPLYDHLSRTAIHAIKAPDVATFFGRSLTSRSHQEPVQAFLHASRELASVITSSPSLTELGRHVAVVGLTLKAMFLVPEFASAALAH